MNGLRGLLFRVGARCMAMAGDIGQAEYLGALARASHAERNYVQADAERWRVIARWRALLDGARLADGLLSTGQSDKAQQQLRVAIIAASGAPKCDGGIS